MEYQGRQIEYVDDAWGAVSIREDLDGTQNIVFHPTRELSEEDRVEVVMPVDLAPKVARALNRAARRAKIT